MTDKTDMVSNIMENTADLWDHRFKYSTVKWKSEGGLLDPVVLFSKTRVGTTIGPLIGGARVFFRFAFELGGLTWAFI